MFHLLSSIASYLSPLQDDPKKGRTRLPVLPLVGELMLCDIHSSETTACSGIFAVEPLHSLDRPSPCQKPLSEIRT